MKVICFASKLFDSSNTLGLFLDTTFLNPKYNFPAQDIALQAAAEIALKEDKPGTLILIGTYQIGKERVLLSVAKALNKKVFVTEEKCVPADAFVKKLISFSPFQDGSFSLALISTIRISFVIRC